MILETLLVRNKNRTRVQRSAGVENDFFVFSLGYIGNFLWFGMPLILINSLNSPGDLIFHWLKGLPTQSLQKNLPVSQYMYFIPLDWELGIEDYNHFSPRNTRNTHLNQQLFHFQTGAPNHVWTVCPLKIVWSRPQKNTSSKNNQQLARHFPVWIIACVVQYSMSFSPGLACSPSRHSTSLTLSTHLSSPIRLR